MMKLAGKNVIITGATSGIGRVCAIECNTAGANVHAFGRNKELLSDMVENMRGDRNSFHGIDLRNTSDISQIINEIVKSYGKIDGFIHSAGYQITAPIKAMTVDQYLDIMLVNTLSAFEITKNLALRKNHTKENLKIVFISSIMSVIAYPGLVAYCASKAALVGGARALAAELDRKSVV